MNQYAITGREMRQLEQAAFEQGVPPVLVMEYAAREVCNALIHLLQNAKGKRVLFLCGSGNNGGDGLAAARYFAQAGGKPAIYFAAQPQTPESLDNWAYCQYLGIPALDVLPDPVDFDGLVDALLGTGLSRAPEGTHADAIRWINEAQLPTLSVDVPSGMDATTGAVPGECVHAHETITFHKAKLGLYLTAHAPYTGRVQVVDIGLTDDPTGIPYYPLSALSHLLPPRPVNAHKGSCGRVLVYGGSLGKAGAAAMCALGALKAGAGLVTIACEKDIMPILQTLVPNAMCVPLDEAEDCNFDVLAAGCGIGQSKHARKTLTQLCRKAQKAVLDADALNLLAASSYKLPKTTVLTPHPLEAARLLEKDLQHILAHPLDSARALALKYDCTAVLKNAVSVIATPDDLALNIVGSPALAKGGSGDALCGILAATLCEKGDPFESSRLACLRMGAAAIQAEKELGDRGVLTSDMLHYLR